ncbi:MAG: hypothetical protein GX283_04020 [Clostridiaceae bacterium]|jgi:hypothetical protein|nr:hypothetical protein [Clostridiaceae bacterium]
MEKTVVVDVMESKIKHEINEVLKPLELKVEKIEFDYKERLLLTINLETIPISQVV